MKTLAEVERGRARLPQRPMPPPPQTVAQAFAGLVWRSARYFLYVLLGFLAYLYVAPAVFAQETTIEVPQGSPVFPSIAQVDCLEEVASGRLCAATWECADGSAGELWGDMGNPDGRRTTSAGHDVAIKRGCVVTVDGQAAVRWFSGFRPAGRTGGLLGVTTMAAAKRPVVRSTAVGASDGLLLDWLIDEHGYDVQGLLDDECGHIRDEATERRQQCESTLREDLRSLLPVASTEYTRCVGEYAVEGVSALEPHHGLTAERSILGDLLENLGTDRICRRLYGDADSKRDECCALYFAEAERFGVGRVSSN